MITALRASLAALRPGSRRTAWMVTTVGPGGRCADWVGTKRARLKPGWTGFWRGARGAESEETQVSRWSWLRRPAAMLWLALGLVTVSDHLSAAAGTDLRAVVRTAAGVAALWAALELLAALPFARPYPDWP